MNWEYIKKMIKNNEIDSVVELCNEMNTQEAQIIKERLIQELRYTHEVGDRNTIAIILGDLKCDEAIYETKWYMYELLSEKREFMNEADKTNCINILREERDKLLEIIDFLEDVFCNIFVDES